ncbi:hypothetical protein SSS_07716 [Sarcoptes scabiei]|nr:hypothetical protein SSS_07716 [Sarcoptes scabiei]
MKFDIDLILFFLLSFYDRIGALAIKSMHQRVELPFVSEEETQIFDENTSTEKNEFHDSITTDSSEYFDDKSSASNSEKNIDEISMTSSYPIAVDYSSQQTVSVTELPSKSQVESTSIQNVPVDEVVSVSENPISIDSSMTTAAIFSEPTESVIETTIDNSIRSNDSIDHQTTPSSSQFSEEHGLFEANRTLELTTESNEVAYSSSAQSNSVDDNVSPLSTPATPPIENDSDQSESDSKSKEEKNETTFTTAATIDSDQSRIDETSALTTSKPTLLTTPNSMVKSSTFRNVQQNTWMRYWPAEVKWNADLMPCLNSFENHWEHRQAPQLFDIRPYFASQFRNVWRNFFQHNLNHCFIATERRSIQRKLIQTISSYNEVLSREILSISEILRQGENGMFLIHINQPNIKKNWSD